MKKLLLILVGLSFLLVPVLAQENEELPDPGITPDSIFYGLDRAFERLQLILAFNHTEKAKLHLKFASERIAEVKVMINKKKEKHVNKTLEDYEEELNKTNEEVEKARGIGQNVSNIVKQINVSTEKHIAVLNLVLEKVPEQAKPAIQRAINNSERIKAKIKIRTETRDEIKEVNKTEINKTNKAKAIGKINKTEDNETE